MKKLIGKIRSLSYEERLVYTTAVTMTVTVLISAGKILIGLFSDFILVVVGIFGVLLFAAKLQCILGAKKTMGNFKLRNALIALFLLSAGLIYIFYMGRLLFFDVANEEYGQFQAVATATISFFEMGLAIYGLVKTKNKGHYFRDIKIVNFVSGMTAIMTAQIALTSFTGANANFYSGLLGVGIGIVTILLAIYVYFTPRISIVDREHNVFLLKEPEENALVDMNGKTAEIVLCKSKIYSACVYRATITGTVVNGHIVKLKSGLRQINPFAKTVLIVLSEILVFAWLVGYAAYFFRALDLPGKLESMMAENGFEKTADPTAPPTEGDRTLL